MDACMQEQEDECNMIGMLSTNAWVLLLGRHVDVGEATDHMQEVKSGTAGWRACAMGRWHRTAISKRRERAEGVDGGQGRPSTAPDVWRQVG